MPPNSARPPSTLISVTAGSGDGVKRPTRASVAVTPSSTTPATRAGRRHERQPQHDRTQRDQGKRTGSDAMGQTRRLRRA